MTDSTNPDHHPYAPPQAPIAEQRATQPTPEFYVVSTGKFLLLFTATLGLYAVYWFYRHWQAYKFHHAAPIWPIPRALFSIFFTHSLTGRIETSLQASGRSVSSLSGMASLYVVFEIVSRISSRLANRSIGWPYTDIVSLLSIIPIGIALLWMQNAANRACADEKGLSNRTLTVANYLWIGLGLLLWALALF